MKIFIRILIITAAAALMISCETGSSTKYEEKLALFCYAKADSTIDSLYLTGTGSVNEAINLENLAVSGADIKLYEKSPADTVFSLVGSLPEYSDRHGVYYMPKTGFPGGFRTGYSYRIEAAHDDFNAVSAETVCPPPLEDVVVKNTETDTEMISITEDPSAVDTLYYRRGQSFDDIKLVSCSYDSLSILFDERMASYRIVPDDICRTDTSFWMEDTTETVWEDYPIETQIFKDKKRYGSDFMEYFLRNISIYWYALYHEGMNTIIFSATDKAYRSYMESRYGGEERYTNVINGLGLFTISNSSAVRSRYRVFVKSLENKYP